MTDLNRYNFKPGDHVIVKGWPPSRQLEVVDTSDRSLLTLKASNGSTLKIGRLAVVKV